MAFLSKSSGLKDKSGLASHTASQPNALPLQAKLRMGRPNDAFEQEADRIADRVVNTPISESIQRQQEEEQPVQRKPLIHEISRYVQRQAMDEDKEAVQKQATNEEEQQPVQQQAMDEEQQPVQKQTEEEQQPVQAQVKEEDEKPVQARAIMAAELNDPETEQLLMASKSDGVPLEPDVLQEMESQFGTRFSHVRIHTDQRASDLCRRLNAEAFTHGNHIYFNEGKYNSTAAEDKRLLAHELTHVVQQSGRIEREMIQRQEELPTLVNENTYRGSEGIISRTNGLRMELPVLRVPAIKRQFIPAQNLIVRPGRAEGERRETNQRTIWDANARDGVGLNTALDRKLEQAAKFGLDSNPIYYFQIGQGQGDRTNYIVGNRTSIRNRLLRPYWTPTGQSVLYEVDHKLEYQLNGSDTIDNLWLLERKLNGSSGRNIDREMERNVNRLINASRDTTVWRGQSPPDFREAKRQFDEIKFRSAEYNLPVEAESGGPYSYTLEQIKENALQLEPIRPMTLSQVRAAGLVGSETRLVIFNNQTGGRRFYINLPNATTGEVPFTDPTFLPGFRPQTAIITPSENTIVTLRGTLWSANPALDFHGIKTQIEITKFAGLEHTGYLNVTGVQRQIEQLFGSENIQVTGMSPIQLLSFDVEGSGLMVIRGKVITSVPLIDGADIDLAIRGNDIRLEKTFSTTDIKIPRPLSITNSSLTVAIGTESGFSLTGQIGLEIPDIGSGLIRAEARTGRFGGARGGFALSGQFEFDRELFDRADVSVSYEMTEAGEQFSISGNIAIPQGKVRGIKRAAITVSYSDNQLSARGDAELDVPGVDRGSLSIDYLPDAWSIGGEFTLRNDIPGIRSGSISANVSKVAGEAGYQVIAHGTAVPNIPGIGSQLTVEYDNGTLNIHARASYNRGLLSGEINVGATNRAVDTNGQPTGDPIDNFIIYGGGFLTIRITPWLQGMVGVQFLPNGEMQVSGTIGIPGIVNVFDRIEVPERELIGMGFDIPIFAIPVGPKSIGLKATIRGGLRAYAGIGPGRLEQLELGLVYNPAREEETHVTGQGRFVIPADAGLRLVVSATIGLDALIGGVEGGLELGGGLGLQASAEANINVDWTPTSGLELNANLGAFVQPKFVFTIDGVIRAWFTFYEEVWRWRLANYEYGSNLRFGVQLPIHYREGEPFNISFNDIQLTYPQIDAQSFLRGLIRDIREQRG